MRLKYYTFFILFIMHHIIADQYILIFHDILYFPPCVPFFPPRVSLRNDRLNPAYFPLFLAFFPHYCRSCLHFRRSANSPFRTFPRVHCGFPPNFFLLFEPFRLKCRPLIKMKRGVHVALSKRKCAAFFYIVHIPSTIWILPFMNERYLQQF